MNIEICPKKVFLILLYCIFVLLFLNVLGIISALYFDHNLSVLIPWFNFNNENNIPTLFSTLILLFSSTLLLIIAIDHKRNGSVYRSWLVLSFIFLYLSMDEFIMIHEHFSKLVRELLNTSGVFYYAWIIPYGVALIVLIIAYLKFLINLPRNIMILFVVSGATFVSGTIGFDMLSGLHQTLHGTKDLVFNILYTCEEFLEMLGIAIFIYTLLTYISSQFKSLTITVNEPN